MKKLLLLCMLAAAVISCKHHNSGPVDKIVMDEVKFPPPVVKPDNEVMEKEPPTVEELKVADPGAKDQKGDPVAETRIDEPVGNADVNAVVEDPAPHKSIEKKIIKEGNISFETGNITKTRKAIAASLAKAGGYISEERESNDVDDSTHRYTLKTRIPAKNFDTFLNDVQATAVQVDNKNISIRDVTTQFIDMSTRLQNKKLLEARYLNLLKQANKMGDILQVENKLTEIRSDIESDQGQLNYMSRQVAYSSLEITFYTKHISTAGRTYGVGDKLWYAITSGWDSLQNFFFWLISQWPTIIIITVPVILFRRWRKRVKAAKA